MDSLFTRKIERSGVEQKNIGNKKQIVRTVYFSGPVSSSELSRSLNLSTPKINSLLQELVKSNVLRELGPGDSSGGRRPAIFGLVEESFYVVGITVNIHRTILSIFNATNQEVSGPHYLDIPMQRDFSLMSQIGDFLKTLIAEQKFDGSKIIGIGMELPGLANIETGENKTYFPGLANLQVKLEEIFGYPVFFDNDARIRAFAEQQFGLARDRKNALVVHADWGIGLGVILAGQLYTGKSGFSGEFGHIPMIENGSLCHCGKRGCLEAIASVSAVERMARAGLRSGAASLLHNLVEGDVERVSGSLVMQAASSGDQFSISLFAEIGQWLGKGIVSLIQLFNPELIIIGGKLAAASQFLAAPMHQSIALHANPDIALDTEILFSAMGEKAGTIGAAAYAMDQLAQTK